MLGTTSVLKITESSFFHCANIQFIGVRIILSRFITGAAKEAKVSGCSLARLFGVISPKVKTVTVVTIVEIVAPYCPYRFINKTVATAVLAIFTRLFPTKIVESRLS